MKIRNYEQEDCPSLAKLFYDTVHTVNAADYAEEQLCVWAPENLDLTVWNQSFLGHTTLVAETDGVIVGFGDMDREGYFDRLYVHKDFQRKGVASALCRKLEESVNSGSYTTYASITAKGFFEKMGYFSVQENLVRRQGVTLKNYYMRKTVQK